MDTYSLFRQIADSWMLLGMPGFFASATIWAFLPNQSSARANAPSLRSPRKDTPMAEKKPDEGTGVEIKGHSWDRIEELNNPLPRWWLYACIFWAIAKDIAAHEAKSPVW